MNTLKALYEFFKAAPMKGKPLNLRQATTIVVIVGGMAALCAGNGIHEALVGQAHQSLHDCIVAVAMLMTLPIHVYNFVRVKKGFVVPNPWLMFGPLSGRVPLSIKVALVGSLTVLVAVVSYLSLSPLLFAPHVHFASRFLMITIGFNFFLWAVVAFAWYLFVILHQHRPHRNELALEQGKDVWPPAPLVPATSAKSEKTL